MPPKGKGKAVPKKEVASRKKVVRTVRGGAAVRGGSGGVRRRLDLKPELTEGLGGPLMPIPPVTVPPKPNDGPLTGHGVTDALLRGMDAAARKALADAVAQGDWRATARTVGRFLRDDAQKAMLKQLAAGCELEQGLAAAVKSGDDVALAAALEKVAASAPVLQLGATSALNDLQLAIFQTCVNLCSRCEQRDPCVALNALLDALYSSGRLHDRSDRTVGRCFFKFLEFFYPGWSPGWITGCKDHIGVDGAKRGWSVVVRSGPEPSESQAATVSDIWFDTPPLDVICEGRSAWVGLKRELAELYGVLADTEVEPGALLVRQAPTPPDPAQWTASHRIDDASAPAADTLWTSQAVAGKIAAAIGGLPTPVVLTPTFSAQKVEQHDVNSLNGFEFLLAGDPRFNGVQPGQVYAFASAYVAPWVGPGLGAAEDPLRALPVVGLDAGGKLKVTVTIHSADWAAIPTTGAKGTRIGITVLRGNE